GVTAAFSSVRVSLLGALPISVDGHHLEFVSAKDFETDAHTYHVTVRASDGANTTDQPITVTLTDLNDNAPVLTSSATPSVAENTTAVVDLTAKIGGASCRERVYTVVGGVDVGLFKLVVVSHDLFFSSAKDFETDAHIYHVTVRASDGANTTDQPITVTLTDVNDNAPVLTSSATPSVAENTTAVVDLTATDADTVGGPTAFSIVGGADMGQFQLAVDGHHLEFVSAKDFETDAHKIGRASWRTRGR